ncbi:MAG: hypothetical protein PVJ43_14385 [Gemmatimonadales bacterium]
MAADKLHPREQPRDGESVEPRVRAPWVRPEVTELPPLTELTLQTGDPIGGGGDTGGGGSSVF